MLDQKNPLNITLAEPVVFLRPSDPSGRHQTDPNDSPTLVRGVLTLNVVKPIEISSIEVELSGMLAVSGMEGIGAHRVEIPERQKIYSSSVTVFRAHQVLHRIRPASIGPGLPAATAIQGDGHTGETPSRIPSLRRGRSQRRSVVADRDDLGPTPLYTPIVQSLALIQATEGASEEDPAHTLEELRQALRHNLEEQTSRNVCAPLSSCLPSVTFPLANPRTYSSASSTSHSSLSPEDDHYDEHPFECEPSPLCTNGELAHILHRGAPPSRMSRAHSHEDTCHAFGTQSSICDASKTSAHRSRFRFSLGSVLGAVKGIASRSPSRSRDVARLQETDHGRTRARVADEQLNGERTLEVSEGDRSDEQLGEHASYPSGHKEHGEHHLLGLGRFLRGHERGDAKDVKEHGHGWKEFKSGTYSYPISFLLPPDLPPTCSVMHGSLDYVVKAVAHRAGTFTSKLSCKVPLLVVASPAVGSGETIVAGDPGPLFVEKHWEGKLAYSLGLSSRLFLLGSQRNLDVIANEGLRADTETLMEATAEARAEAAYGTAKLELTLLPLEKVKIWKLTVVIDQHVRYVDGRGKVYRADEERRVKLLEVKDTCLAEEVYDEEQTRKNKAKNKQERVQIPLLPTPISPHRSPLLQFLPPSSDPSILVGAGPYTLSTNIGLPGCGDASLDDNGLYFTMRRKNFAVKVEHNLRVIVRVERVGNEDEGDKKKLFDISVQTPITILSCRCAPQSQTLPRYSQTSEDYLQNPDACPCQPTAVGSTERHDHLGVVVTPTSVSFESDDGVHCQADEHSCVYDTSRSSSRARWSGHATPLSGSVHPRPLSPAHGPMHPPGQSYHARSHSYTSTSHGRHVLTPLSLTPHSTRPPSPLARYERLVAGLESEVGEAPPSYESIASSP